MLLSVTNCPHPYADILDILSSDKNLGHKIININYIVVKCEIIVEMRKIEYIPICQNKRRQLPPLAYM